ncbi:guanidinobutyrase [Paracoccidioides lutzii Pb01]|uniref:Guanidinobutyrase n=1 Tax=Paracoccidioides lutzii (strain ATCC MYA-826 / Pb01) TaxID=502779 RepID=C1GVF2_PARBA|nr:guanidinobutyrase [Paracoccidioides lutzii Pb01]EEH40174.1 guanidinobutyrase [Paracoccidioides lutzii Pb01]
MPITETYHDHEKQQWGFAGISTFTHLQHVRCLLEPDDPYDIAILGTPFDNAVSYRPGARAIRAASARQIPANSYNIHAGINQYLNWARILNCGDIPANPFDNGLAKRQIYEAFLKLATRDVPNPIRGISIILPALRASSKIYGKLITVLHFDAHPDTGNPIWYSAFWTSDHSRFNHGSFFHTASLEGLISNTSSAHAGLRTRLTGLDDGDYSNPGPEQGFLRIHADNIDDIGAHVWTLTCWILLSPLELARRTLGGRVGCGIEKLNLVDADIVEVSPIYDNVAEGTALAVAQVAFEIMSSMVKLGAKEDVG